MKGIGIAGLVLMAAAAWGGPLEPKQVSSDAKWLVHADLDRLRLSEVGKQILAELDKDEPKRKLDAFQAIFGLDPRKDVSSLTIYGQGDKEEDTVALFKAKFDASRLITLAKANDSYEESTYGTRVLYSWLDKKGGREKRTFATFVSDGTLAIGGRAAVEAAVDVVDGKRPNIQSAGTLGGLTASDGAYFVVAGANFESFAIANPKAAILKEATSGRLTAGEKNGEVEVGVSLNAKTEQLAAQMADVARGLQAWAILNQAEGPALAEMCRKITIHVNGKAVTGSFTCPVSQLMTLLREQKKPSAKATHDAGTAQ